MSVIEGLSRPLRAAGLALIGVAVVAAVIGGVTLATGNGEEPPEAQPTTDATGATGAQPSPGPGATSPGTAAPSPTGSPSRGAGVPGETTTAAPGQPGDGSGDADGDGSGDSGDGQPGQDRPASAGLADVRVYNNSNIRGLAAEAGETISDRGWTVVETGNYSGGTIPVTTAYYRPDTGEEAAARKLGDQFGIRVEPRFSGIQHSSPGVIVIVTKDWEHADK